MNEEIGLPKATICNLIKSYLPEDTRISNDTNDILLAMATEFVNHLSSTSNDVCLAGGKKTISQIHVAEAMQNLKLNSYLAKIMNLDKNTDYDKLTEKKKREILKNRFGVEPKKKKGRSKEEEEELRRKQQAMFNSDITMSMLPSEINQTNSTPTFKPAEIPAYGGEIYQPTEPKFYDGSITQVLHNPALNTALQVQQNVMPPCPQGTDPSQVPVQSAMQNEGTIAAPAPETANGVSHAPQEVTTPATIPAQVPTSTPTAADQEVPISAETTNMAPVGAVDPALLEQERQKVELQNQELMMQYSIAQLQRQKSKVQEETSDFE